jgi:hypothetical protein
MDFAGWLKAVAGILIPTQLEAISAAESVSFAQIAEVSFSHKATILCCLTEKSMSEQGKQPGSKP